MNRKEIDKEILSLIIQSLKEENISVIVINKLIKHFKLAGKFLIEKPQTKRLNRLVIKGCRIYKTSLIQDHEK